MAENTSLTDSTYEHLRVERRPNGVVLVTLDRPERLNAIDRRLHQELTQLPIDVAYDSSARVLVLTGRGRAFSAGGDFSPRDDWGSADPAEQQDGRRLIDNFLALEKPVIAAVNGHAVGLGATLALLADVLVVGNATSMSDPHVKMGIVPGDGGALLWPLLAGLARAKWHLMSGEPLVGREIVDAGLATFLVEDGEVLATALAKADILAAGAQQAIMGAKSSMNQLLRLMSTMIMPMAMALEVATLTSADHQEAVRAFQEKRPPRFGA